MLNKVLPIIIMISGFVVLSNCKTTENSAPIALSGDIMINSIEMTANNSNSSLDYKIDDMMTFRGRFTDPDGDETITRAVVEYNVNMGMMNHSGQITMWDDGTHGDMTPGDGWYHMEDEMEVMMLMMGIDWGMMTGEYNFEFYCFDDEGNESNHIHTNLSLD